MSWDAFKRSVPAPIRWCAGIALLLAILLILAYLPIGKPDDSVRVMHLGPKFNIVNRELLMSKSRGKISHLPRSVSMTSNGPKFRAYLIDTGAINDALGKVNAFMDASQAIERGEEPTKAPIKERAVGVTEAEFRLHPFPWGISSRYMLIVACDEDAEVTVRVNYGQ